MNLLSCILAANSLKLSTLTGRDFGLLQDP